MNFLTRLFNRSTWKWLYVGLGIKRWLLLLFLGATASALGLTYILVDIYRETPLPAEFFYITLQFMDRSARGLLFIGLGLVMVVIAVTQLSQSLVSAFAAEDTNLVEVLYRRRIRRQGPKIVAIGGGTGLSTLLRGLKEHTDKLTAIVTVADDGGSSGKLRRELGVLPPGDLRQCIAALADAEPLMTALFQYRFGKGSGLDGHSFGNLFIAAMAGVTGNFERGLLESSRVLAVRGQILPATLQSVTLYAETRNQEPPNDSLERIAGESEITHRGQVIDRVYLDPEHASAYPGVVRAILDADLIIAGPGSLFTSIIPNLLVDDIRRALQVAQAKKIYICNVATQPGETDAFSIEEHLDTIDQYAGKDIFTHVLANNNQRVNFPEQSPSKMVRLRGDAERRAAITLADIVDEDKPWRHDPAKLAKEIIKWYTAHSVQKI